MVYMETPRLPSNAILPCVLAGGFIIQFHGPVGLLTLLVSLSRGGAHQAVNHLAALSYLGSGLN